jgi:hypothetical protein
MKVSALVAVLGNFENAVVAAAGVETRSDFKELRDLFLGYEDKNVAQFVDTLIKLRDVHGRRATSRSIAVLREALIKLETCLRSADGKKAADDVAKLAKLLEGCGQVSVHEFVTEAHEWLVEASRPKVKLRSNTKSARSARKKPAVSVETLPPADYVSLLKRTVKDNAQFDQTIERLQADSKIRTPDMRDIARQFLGYELAKSKGRKDALEEIMAKQRIEARGNARGSVLDRLKPW